MEIRTPGNRKWSCRTPLEEKESNFTHLCLELDVYTCERLGAIPWTISADYFYFATPPPLHKSKSLWGEIWHVILLKAKGWATTLLSRAAMLTGDTRKHAETILNIRESHGGFPKPHAPQAAIVRISRVAAK